MSTTVLATKLYIPPPRAKTVLRPRLIDRLNEGLHHKLTLISAPAGFGKTTLLAEWLYGKDEGREARMKDEIIIHPSSPVPVRGFIPRPSSFQNLVHTFKPRASAWR